MLRHSEISIIKSNRQKWRDFATHRVISSHTTSTLHPCCFPLPCRDVARRVSTNGAHFYGCTSWWNGTRTQKKRVNYSIGSHAFEKIKCIYVSAILCFYWIVVSFERFSQNTVISSKHYNCNVKNLLQRITKKCERKPVKIYLNWHQAKAGFE